MLQVLAIGAALAGAAAAWFAYRQFQAQKALAELEERPIAEAEPGGLVQIVGVVTPVSETLISPHLNRECVYYRYQKQRYRSRTGNSSGGWYTVASQEDSVPFLLQDGTGSARIDPKGARLILKKDVDESSGMGLSFEVGGFSIGSKKERTMEIVVEPDDTLRVIGRAHGTRERADSRGVSLLVSGKDSPVFFLTDKPKDEVLEGFSTRSWAFGMLAVLLLGVAGVALFGRFAPEPPLDPSFRDPGARPLELKLKPRQSRD